MTQQEYVDEFIETELSSHFERADDKYEVVVDLQDSHITDFKARYGKEISGFFSQAEQQMNLRLGELKENGSVEIDRSWFPTIVLEIGDKQMAYLNLLLNRFFKSNDFVFKQSWQEIYAIFEEHENLVSLNLNPLLEGYVKEVTKQ
tara:strand:- start:453 stop:890 length:438 start_codon:yes stop_codon:yes gene_type:complete